MMKKNVISMFTVLLTVICFLFYSAFAASLKTSEKFFSGRLIYLADNYIELKKGKAEVLVYFADNTKFISRDGKESMKDILKVCQYIEAYYTDGTKKILNKIIIKEESDCVK
jgi:hypothetical protein